MKYQDTEKNVQIYIIYLTLQKKTIKILWIILQHLGTVLSTLSVLTYLILKTNLSTRYGLLAPFFPIRKGRPRESKNLPKVMQREHK